MKNQPKKNQPNKTIEIFALACHESQTGMDGYGLTNGGVDKIAGCIGQHSKTEAEFVNEAKNYAENFKENVQHAIESIKLDEDPRAASSAANLKVMRAMLIWHYDENEMEKLARDEWQDYHATELQA